MKDLDNPTVGPVHLQLFRPSVIRGPWYTPLNGLRPVEFLGIIVAMDGIFLLSIQGLAIYRWTELQWNVDFVKGHTVGYPWHFKSNEDIITKFKWHELQIIRINREKIGGSGITPSYFPALTNMTIFGRFSLYRDKG